MKSFLIIITLAFASFLFAKDSVSVNVAPQRQGAITIKMIAYDGEQVVREW